MERRGSVRYCSTSREGFACSAARGTSPRSLLPTKLLNHRFMRLATLCGLASSMSLPSLAEMYTWSISLSVPDTRKIPSSSRPRSAIRWRCMFARMHGTVNPLSVVVGRASTSVSGRVTTLEAVLFLRLRRLRIVLHHTRTAAVPLYSPLPPRSSWSA